MGSEDTPSHEAVAAAAGLHRAGDLEGAEAAYRRVLARDPRHSGALHLLGVLEHQRGRHDRAVEQIGRAITLDPSQAAYHNNLGVALKATGRLDEAASAYREALRLAPGYADASANLGVALHELGRPAEAVPCFEAALRARPDHPDALYNLANLLHGQGRSAEAVALYGRALRAAPGRADIPNNLGNALIALGREEEAVAAYRRALGVDPAHADAWANLGTALAQLDRVEEAADCFAAAARHRPGEAHWPLRIAALCPAVFPDAGAIDRYRGALEAALDAHREHGLRLAEGATAAAGCTPSFNINHQGRCDRALKEKFAALFRDLFPPREVAPGGGVPRVGFLATYPHEGGFLRCTAGIVDRLAPDRFRPVVFGTARGMPALRAGVRHPGAEFVPIPEDLAGAAEVVAAARCDVLYHWQIGTDPLNYFLAFARLAPVQCTSWGTHATSGVPAVDYYLSSALIETDAADAHYTESLVRLATLPTYQRPVPRPVPAPDRSEFGLPPGANLYACLQRVAKLHPDFDARLAGILRRDPRGLVVLAKDRGGWAAGRLAERLRATMPDAADRVVFLPRQPLAGYYRLLALADVVLDPPYFGSGITAYDAFGLGLPLVTLPGELNIGRYAQACYHKMGLPDLVAAPPQGYVDLAVRLGTDRAYRDEAAARVAAASPVLFEDAEAVREHERFFERAVEAARSGAPAATPAPAVAAAGCGGDPPWPPRAPVAALRHRDQFGAFLNQLGLVGAGAEVGVEEGRFARRVLDQWRGRRLFLVDIWQPLDGYRDVTNAPAPVQVARLIRAVGRVAPHWERVRLIQQLSEEAARLVPDGSLDWVYLDADHEYTQVLRDLAAWTPKVRPGGLIAGHDFVDGDRVIGGVLTAFGVARAVREFFAGRDVGVTEEAHPSWYVRLDGG